MRWKNFTKCEICKTQKADVFLQHDHIWKFVCFGCSHTNASSMRVVIDEFFLHPANMVIWLSRLWTVLGVGVYEFLEMVHRFGIATGEYEEDKSCDLTKNVEPNPDPIFRQHP
jgi:hypothetical protein